MEEAQTALDEFEQEHRAIFDRYSKLLEEHAIATNVFKEAARQADSFETRRYSIIVDHKTRRWIDADAFLQRVPDAERRFKGLILKSIDTTVMKALVKAGQIDQAVVKACEKSEPMTSAVTIKGK